MYCSCSDFATRTSTRTRTPHVRSVAVGAPIQRCSDRRRFQPSNPLIFFGLLPVPAPYHPYRDEKRPDDSGKTINKVVRWSGTRLGSPYSSRVSAGRGIPAQEEVPCRGHVRVALPRRTTATLLHDCAHHALIVIPQFAPQQQALWSLPDLWPPRPAGQAGRARPAWRTWKSEDGTRRRRLFPSAGGRPPQSCMLVQKKAETYDY